MKEFCLETMKLKYPATKAILYICLGIICYLIASPCIVAGVLLMISGILYIFAQINQNEEAHDGTSKLISSNNSKNSTTTRGNNFGTFI